MKLLCFATLLFALLLVACDVGVPATLTPPAATATVAAPATATGVARPATVDNEIDRAALMHDSRNTLYREPGGAQPEGGRVTLRIKTAQNDLGSAKVRLWNNSAGQEQILPLSFEKTADGGDYWSITVDLPKQPTVLWYRFILADGSTTIYYEENVDRDGGLGTSWSQQPGYDYSIDVYDPNWKIPAWVQDAVVYQIFPDRFNNGDPANDKPAGSFIYGDQTIQARWGDPPEQPAHNRDFYGGDLQGVIDKLDYLHGLGVTLIYFNPIFAAPSNHRYDTTDYMKIDPALGDKATFDKLIAEAQKRGIRVMLDGVFNHTSSDSIYFDKFQRYSTTGADEAQDSPYFPWFTFTNWPKFYNGWAGLDTLPQLTEGDAVRDFLFRKPDSVAQTWLGAGAAGWRLDAAEQKSHAFWQDFRSSVRGAYPDALIIGEYWQNANTWFEGNEWDGVMNYRFRDVALSFVGGAAPQQTDRLLASIREDYPPNAVQASMNLIDSHDTMRALTSMGDNKNKLMQLALLQFTSPGMPTIYYGDEAGLAGGSDPDDRRTYPWDSADQNLIKYYSTLAAVRHKLPALSSGSYTTLLADNDRQLYVYLRKDGAGQAVVAFNTGDGGQKDVALDPQGQLADGTSFADVLTDGTPYKVNSGKLIITVPAHWGSLLVPDAVAKDVMK